MQIPFATRVQVAFFGVVILVSAIQEPPNLLGIGAGVAMALWCAWAGLRGSSQE